MGSIATSNTLNQIIAFIVFLQIEINMGHQFKLTLCIYSLDIRCIGDTRDYYEHAFEEKNFDVNYFVDYCIFHLTIRVISLINH